MYTLLIVDDEYLVRRGIKQLVDYDTLNISEVYEASNGKEALEIFMTHKPGLILADINMPEMNGLELAEKVKAHSPGTKIALITGYDYFDYAVTALKAGVDDYVLKPVSKKDIEALLKKLIQKIQNDKVNFETRELLKEVHPTSPGNQEQEGYEEQLSQIIENELGNSELSLSFIGERIGLSSGYVSQLFKKLFNAPFKTYIMNKRMDKAKLLLLSTELKNYEIAESLGFEDPNYFSNCFKKVVGMSPGHYRDHVKE